MQSDCKLIKQILQIFGYAGKININIGSINKMMNLPCLVSISLLANDRLQISQGQLLLGSWGLLLCRDAMCFANRSCKENICPQTGHTKARSAKNLKIICPGEIYLIVSLYLKKYADEISTNFELPPGGISSTTGDTSRLQRRATEFLVVGDAISPRITDTPASLYFSDLHNPLLKGQNHFMETCTRQIVCMSFERWKFLIQNLLKVIK